MRTSRPLSFKRHRFPREVILHAAWLYFRFTLSLHDVEELLKERGIEVSYAAIRTGMICFGSLIGRRLKKLRAAQTGIWTRGSALSDVGSLQRF